jgi:hypothetical protein
MISSVFDLLPERDISYESYVILLKPQASVTNERIFCIFTDSKKNI